MAQRLHSWVLEGKPLPYVCRNSPRAETADLKSVKRGFDPHFRYDMGSVRWSRARFQPVAEGVRFLYCPLQRRDVRVP